MNKKYKPTGQGQRSALLTEEYIRQLPPEERLRLAADALIEVQRRFNCILQTQRDPEQEKRNLADYRSKLNWRMRLLNFLLGIKLEPVYKTTLAALNYPNGANVAAVPVQRPETKEEISEAMVITK